MERAEDDAALAHDDRVAADLGKHLNPVADPGHPRRPDEHRSQRLRADALDLQIRLEARDLAAEGVASAGDVSEAQVLGVADDHPRARAENRPPRLDVGANRGLEPVPLDRLRDRGRLAAGDDERVEAIQLLRVADLDRVGAEPAQHLGVRREAALAREYADPQAAAP